jgi:hypothetical protein
MFNGRRQPSRGGTSRMTRECQVRFCERLGVKFPGPTRHSRRFDRVQLTSGLTPQANIIADRRHVSKAPDSDSRYLFGGGFGGATEAAKGSRGSDPRLLGLTMGWLLDRTLGSDPVHRGSSRP